MNALDIYNKIVNHKGQNIPACWERPCQTLAEVPMKITKRTCAYVRAGIEYANLSSVKEAIESGERDEVGKLPWGKWRDGYKPFIIDHTPKGQTENVEYIRLYPCVFSNLKTTVEYFIDGKLATKEDVRPYVKASEVRESDEPIKCFTLKAETVVRIGKEDFAFTGAFKA
jgi:hypothetical protein